MTTPTAKQIEFTAKMIVMLLKVSLVEAQKMAAAGAMLEALQVAVACGEPDKVSLYDEEGVEGWRWSHPNDDREWTEVGDWSEVPPHPMIEAAIELAEGQA